MQNKPKIQHKMCLKCNLSNILTLRHRLSLSIPQLRKIKNLKYQSPLLLLRSVKSKSTCIEHSKENTTTAKTTNNYLKGDCLHTSNTPKRDSQIHTLTSFTLALKCLGEEFTLSLIARLPKTWHKVKS